MLVILIKKQVRRSVAKMSTKMIKIEDNEVLVDKDHLQELEADRNWLDCLEACGVDNWSGFTDAQDMYTGGDE